MPWSWIGLRLCRSVELEDLISSHSLRILMTLYLQILHFILLNTSCRSD